MSVFHLKYRPVRIADLDLASVSKTLTAVLRGKEVAPAFLFAGPKGSGKTSAARILARAVNCQNRDGVEPCGKCEICQEISSGRSIDVLEIDAASNRGIDDARSLRERAILLPSRLTKKVFIVDEVHMLTKEAFNALLKLIEEPPKHTFFILCTTDANKIPETVLSRLVRVDFHKGSRAELLKSLARVIGGEKINIDEGALDLIVKKSDGSFRNIHRLFNEIAVEFGKKISQKQVADFLSAKLGGYSEAEFETDLIKGDVKTLISKLEKMAEIGADLVDFREKLLRHFHAKLLVLYGVGESDGSKLEKSKLIGLIDLLVRAGEIEKLAVIDQLPLELVVIEFLNSNNQKTTNQLPKKEEEKEIEVIAEVKRTGGVVKLEEVTREWGNILQAVKPFNHSVEAFLRASRPVKVAGEVLVLEVFYPFHKDRLEEDRNRAVVEEALKRVFGIIMRLECQLGQNKKAPLVVRNETPISEVVSGDKDIYEMAKEIFG